MVISWELGYSKNLTLAGRNEKYRKNVMLQRKKHITKLKGKQKTVENKLLNLLFWFLLLLLSQNSCAYIWFILQITALFCNSFLNCMSWLSFLSFYLWHFVLFFTLLNCFFFFSGNFTNNFCFFVYLEEYWEKQKQKKQKKTCQELMIK